MVTCVNEGIYVTFIFMLTVWLITGCVMFYTFIDKRSVISCYHNTVF
jgi:hypothetical protein